MKKRLISLALTAALSLTLFTTGALAADLDTKSETIRALGIMTGNETGDLNLLNQVTRAEFAVMMTAASSYQDTIGSGYGVSLFKDVKSDHWASEYIKLAVEQGWMSGYVDGTFRPDSTVKLEEACCALLHLLGYDSSSLAGSFPTAQLSKASAIGLLDDVTATRGEALTKGDCVDLFYNLLVTQTTSGTLYGTSLGYNVTNGEIDYATLVNADTKGPYVASAQGSLTLPSSSAGMTVYRNDGISSIAEVNQYDVYYYNTNLQTVWVYSDRATGTLTGLSPSKTAPTSATVAGVTYSIGTSAATYKLSRQGVFSEGDLVTLLLGMNGEIVDVVSVIDSETTYYGVVLSSEKAASTASTSSGSASVQVITRVACTDGTIRSFYHSGGTRTVGKLVSVSTTETGTSVKTLSDMRLSGSVNSSGTKLAGYDFAENVKILDTDENGGYARIYPSRIAGAKLTDQDVRYYTLDTNGDIDSLILNNVTGDTYSYIYVTSAEKVSEGMNISSSYQYIKNGENSTFSSNTTIYPVDVGGAVQIYKDGQLKSMRQLSSVTVDQLSTLYATSGSKKYSLAEDVQVLLRDSTGGGYYATTLSQINDSDYKLTGWYDSLGCSAGARIRILVAAAK